MRLDPEERVLSKIQPKAVEVRHLPKKASGGKRLSLAPEDTVLAEPEQMQEYKHRT